MICFAVVNGTDVFACTVSSIVTTIGSSRAGVGCGWLEPGKEQDIRVNKMMADDISGRINLVIFISSQILATGKNIWIR